MKLWWFMISGEIIDILSIFMSAFISAILSEKKPLHITPGIPNYQ
jgi:hypothetical protein